MGNVRRRPRGSLNNADYTQTNYRISIDSKQVLEAFAANLGVTAAEGLDRLLSHFKTELEQSSDGLPNWINRDQLPEELPIARAS